MDHNGFRFIQCLSECIELYPGSFDASISRKGGAFNFVPADHDVNDELAAYKMADQPFPGQFGIFYQKGRCDKNGNEAKIIADHRAKFAGLADWRILQKNFDRMK